MHHHHFIITKLLFLIGILVGAFYVFDYIKEKYQAYQAYQAQKTYYQKVDKGRKSLERKMGEGFGDEEGKELEKKKRILKGKANKACFVYSEWEDCKEE
jgi:hypothetical protein